VTILLFHDIDKNTAERTFAYLSRKYNIIALNDFLEAHEKKDRTRLPDKALIVTFDDGHINNRKILPILKKYKIPVTIFLCASIINTNRNFWWESEDLLIPASELKRVSRDWYKDLIRYGFDIDKEYNEPQALQKSHIEEMKHWTNFQSHTLYHPILPKCIDNEAEVEIVNSKELLERGYGLKIDAISYPNGDYSERDILIAKRAGYRCGITVDRGYNTIHSDLFRLKRLSVNDTNNISELIVKASGFWAFIKH
jgi:peptidoglycan/xylan/chitin deacetylase (PgdA/CDA1 family)